MENVLLEDISVGIYRIKDRIKNFKIRVKVRKISNACFSEKDSIVFGNPNELELVNIMKAPSAKAEKVFSWQEKIDKNQKETDTNNGQERDNCKNNSMIISLFTIVDSDILSHDWKNQPPTVPTSQSSYLEQQISKFKPKPRLLFNDMQTWQKPLFSGTKKLVKEKNRSKENTFPVRQSMLIMANLTFDDSSPNEEIQVCCLQIDDRGTLIIYPDFTKQKPYIFLNSRSETFEYEIENISPMPNDVTIKREKYLTRKISLYKKRIKEDKLQLFNQVESSTLSNVTINCEIVSVENFACSDIFVHYTVIIPKGWNSESELEGITETCKVKVKMDVTVAYYGYLFSIDLTEKTSTEETESKFESLKVIFEITSIDFWGNIRNEGYGYADIMLIPGEHTHNIHTWKLEPISLKSKLQYFFIGGMPILDDLSYVIKPKDCKALQLSKFGLRTLSSGSLKFKSSVICQNFTADLT